MNSLIRDLFLKYLDNGQAEGQTDAAILPWPGDRLAFTTDSFVVDPLFFPGGDIGKLAVCGTLNDLAVSGATPLYLSVSFILEEGFSLDELEKIVSSMGSTAREAGVPVVTGDTKVVPRGKADKIFITTSGVGRVPEQLSEIAYGTGVRAGDRVIVNGTLGDHGIAVLLKRESFHFHTDVRSDCANLFPLVSELTGSPAGIHFMRDATRGGLATVLCELTGLHPVGIELNERAIPVNPSVRSVCELLGMDPLYIANEGKVVIVVAEEMAEELVGIMRNHPLGRDAAIIGQITAVHTGKVIMKTAMGGTRWIDYLTGDQLPRIC